MEQAQEECPSSPTPAQGSLLDAAINQLLKEKPSPGDSSFPSECRENKDLSILRHVELQCISGDTLVIVNFPPGYIDCKGEEWKSKRFCVHSKKLLATGSKVFANLLSPKRQDRIRKRIKGSFTQRYVIDLTPSMEGDELAAQLIELSVPPGVRDWWTSKERLGISPYLVSGHDDHCPFHNTVLVDCKKTKNYVPKRTDLLPNIDLSHIETPESRIIDDYCPIRHRANIVRLVLAIEGYDLVLNSAPRVYTLTGVANILDCTNVIRDSVYTWFIAEPNTEFIDINTEAAFKIAWTLKLDDITRAAFRILVAEKALDTLATQPPTPTPRCSIFGRPRMDLPDDLQTVVQYAAHKFADRAQQTLTQMRSSQFYDTIQIPEQRKLVKIGKLTRCAISNLPNQGISGAEANSLRSMKLDNLRNASGKLSERLIAYKNHILSEAMKSQLTTDQQSDFNRDRRCYVSDRKWVDTTVIYGGFSDTQRLLSPHFWENLVSYPRQYSGANCPAWFLGHFVDRFNYRLDEAVPYINFEASGIDPENPHFEVQNFRDELSQYFGGLFSTWTKPKLEMPLTRTNHLVLSLLDEFQYLPLWADGLDDGTGGVFDAVVPDADLGPIGPGPAYHSGATIGTDVSSIDPSVRTPSQASTATLTAGRSIAAVPSNAGPSTVHGGTSVTSATESLDDDVELLDYEDSDGTDEAWSHVDEPLT